MPAAVRNLVALVVFVLVAVLGANAGLAQTPDEGQMLFEQKCASCHTFGGGPRVGPDLEGAPERLGGLDALEAFILAPDEMRPGTAMPNLGLTEAEAAALGAFLAAGESGSEPAPEETAPPETAPPETSTAETAPVAGDAAEGKALFEGTDRFANGGPPCMSCHTVAGIGSLGGGSIGPDLTAAFEKFSGPGLAASLEAIPFPTMQPIYGGQPITAAERESLVAFLAEASTSERPASSVWKLFLLGLGGALALFAVGALVWRGRLASVRRGVVGRATERRGGGA